MPTKNDFLQKMFSEILTARREQQNFRTVFVEHLLVKPFFCLNVWITDSALVATS